MTTIDMSGTPRSIEEIEEALRQIKAAMLDPVFCVHRPKLTVMLPTVIDVLKHELAVRGSPSGLPTDLHQLVVTCDDCRNQAKISTGVLVSGSDPRFYCAICASNHGFTQDED